MKLAAKVGMALALAAGVAAGQQPAPAAQPSQPPQGDRMKRPPGGYVGLSQKVPAPPMRPDLGAWWKNSDIVQELGLSQQQVSQIEQAFFDHRLKLIDLKAAVEREEMKLQPLIEADQVNEAQVSTQIGKVVAARGGLEIANVMMMLSMRKVLTVDQWKKLEAIRHHREEKFKWWIEGGKGGPEFKWRMDPNEAPTPPPGEFERWIPDRP